MELFIVNFRRKNLTFPKISPFPKQALVFTCLQCSLLKTLWEKEKSLVMSNFSFTHSVFYPFGELSAIVIIFNCCLQSLSVWKRLKFVVLERLKAFALKAVFQTGLNLKHLHLKSNVSDWSKFKAFALKAKFQNAPNLRHLQTTK